MVKINNIYEKKDILPFLQKRGLTKQYIKAKTYILSNSSISTNLKKRQPNGSGIFYFRINQQFRAYGVFNTENNFIIFKIDNHQ